jgi:5'-3' exonuclease
MGIKTLNKFLSKHISSLYTCRKPLTSYSNKKIAIDTSIYLFELKQKYKTKWVIGLVNFITLFRKNNINAVFIFDTKSPQEKDATKQERRDKRREITNRISQIKEAMENYNKTNIIDDILLKIMDKRQSEMSLLLSDSEISSYVNMNAINKELDMLSRQVINITHEDVLLTKEILNSLGVSFYDSDNEAETLCAYLCYHKIVDAVLSNDTDVLAYQTPLFLTKLSYTDETVAEVEYELVLNNLELSNNQFTDLCIMSGTDYNKNIFRIGNEKAYKLIKQYGSIDSITHLDTSILNHIRVRELFDITSKNEDIDKKIDCSKKNPNWDKVEEFCRKYCPFVNVENLKTIF